ncbi:MAG: helix-turn-helix domain-containing protein [Lachnospiraceae bacterium]|nr:helix-turn-helix domain-containing protein [Lachnospiraceae bacterium]
MKQSGMKQKDIADELGISPSYVTQLLKDCSQSQFLFSNGVSPSYPAKMPKMKDE